MKTIAELQQEIRSIRKELKSIDGRLDTMDSELFNYKDVATGKSEYKRIYEIAKTLPIIEHPVMGESVSVKKNYLGTLLMLATIDGSINDDQLLFIQRIIMNDSNCKQLDYYVSEMGSILPENIIYNLSDSIEDILAKQLMLDMLIVEKLSNNESAKAYQLIASIAKILKLSTKDITMIALVAKTVLIQQVDNQLTESVLEVNNYFGYYLNDISVWNQYVKKEYIKRLITLLVRIKQ